MKITATFSNSLTISRNTNKHFTHAYVASNQWQTFHGFASSESLALKAAKNDCKYGDMKFMEIVSVNKQ